jgi:hypothetical protein
MKNKIFYDTMVNDRIYTKRISLRGVDTLDNKKLQLHLQILTEDETIFHNQLIIKNDALKIIETEPKYLKIQINTKDFNNLICYAELCMSYGDFDNFFAKLVENPGSFEKANIYQNKIYHSMRSDFPLTMGAHVIPPLGPVKKFSNIPRDNHKKTLLFILKKGIKGCITNINVRLNNLLFIKKAIQSQIEILNNQQKITINSDNIVDTNKELIIDVKCAESLPKEQSLIIIPVVDDWEFLV